MAYRRVNLAVGEWFHCYTRTIDRSRPFDEKENAERFLETLYLANQSAPMPIMPLLYKRYSHKEIFKLERKQQLVAIGAYCIMPTHYHLLVQPTVENGLSEFMHKVGTGFTRFYNDRHERVGNLFIRPFRSKHVSNDTSLSRVANYIHLNPIELFEPGFKRGHVRAGVERKLLSYSYSSLPEYKKSGQSHGNILDRESVITIQAGGQPLIDTIQDAVEYYQSLELDM